MSYITARDTIALAASRPPQYRGINQDVAGNGFELH